MTFSAFCDDAGHFSLDHRDAFRREMAAKFKGQELTVTVKRKAKRQGDQSMRYYRGVVIPDIAEAMGHNEPDEFPEVHQALAWKFLRLADHPQLGYPRRKSTAKDSLSQDEMTAYISQCIEWAEANVVGCRVRRPEELDSDDYYAPDFDEEVA